MKVTPYRKFSLLGLAMLAFCLFVSAAAASVVSIGNGQVNTIGGTTSLNLTLDSAPAGLSGYDINITVADPSIASITSVSFPTWATLKDNSSVPASFIHLTAVDLSDLIQPGAANIPLGTINFKGLRGGSTPVQITVNGMDDDAGNKVSHGVQPGTFSVNVAQPAGNVSVTSAPPVAAISLDGTDTGKFTPARIEGVPPGSHTIGVSLTGYQSASQKVTVSADATVKANFQLVPIPPQTGSISVTSTPVGAAINLDGTDTGKTTPFTLDNVVPGDHTVVVSLTGYNPDTMTVTVTAGTTVQADFQLVQIPVTGTLVVRSTPSGAAIAIDGIDTGNVTPSTFNAVGQGSHIVEVSLANYQVANKTIVVPTGGTVTADFTLVPVPTTGSLNVTSAPSGAAISLDGADTGKITPFIFNDISPGDHTVAVSLTGYNPASTTITIITGETASADFQLVRTPQTGSIFVTSTPIGAAISLDGTDTGEVTPFTLDNIAAGSHTIDVNLPGYNSASKTITVSIGSTVTVDFQLVLIPPPPQTGSISVKSSPAGAAILLDGTGTGKITPATLDSVAPGSHTVTVSLKGYNPASMDVTVSAGSTATADFVLNQIPQTGSIAVSSTPVGAMIEIDGVSTGKVTPYTFDNIAPGDHAVSVSLKGYTPGSQTVTVSAGSTTRADFKLSSAQLTGSISVTSVPAGAAISLDSIGTGKVTPAILDDITPGNHVISLTLNGYKPSSKTVMVSAGSTANASFRLVHTFRQADLAITKSVSNATAYVGENVIWTVTVVNNGPDTARDIVVRDDLSSSSGIKKRATRSPSAGIVFGSNWRIPSLQPGQSAQLTETDAYAVPGTKTDVAKIVKSATNDPVAANNSASASITILAKPAPAPKVISISPSTGEAGSTLRTVIVRGDQFRKGAKVTLKQSELNTIVPSRISVDGKGKISFSLSIPKNSPEGAYDVVVTDTDGQYGTLAGAFTVVAPKAPVVGQISPATGEAGKTMKNLQVSGDNFKSGAVVMLKMAGQHDIVLSGVIVKDAHRITGTLSLPIGTKSGAWDLVVSNPDGKSSVKSAAFTVKDAPKPTPTPWQRH
jgi:uncharacterized repeat protein (TIGR01451 family)